MRLRNNRKKIAALVICFMPFTGLCQGGNYFSVNVKNGILFNNIDLDVKGKKVTEFKNSLKQSIGVNYTVQTKIGILFSAGVDLGYERYKMKVNYPFTENGFVVPATLGPQYQRSTRDPYSQVNVNVGYKFKGGKAAPEIRFGQILHLPMRSTFFSKNSEEITIDGVSHLNMTSRGYFGQGITPAFVGELINSIYIGTTMPVRLIKVTTINVGLQFQKKIIMADNPLNYFENVHNERYGNITTEELFKGTHTSIDLVISLKL